MSDDGAYRFDERAQLFYGRCTLRFWRDWNLRPVDARPVVKGDFVPPRITLERLRAEDPDMHARLTEHVVFDEPEAAVIVAQSRNVDASP